eukprot:12319145-Alexandrium_andersonii.AAC.1
MTESMCGQTLSSSRDMPQVGDVFLFLVILSAARERDVQPGFKAALQEVEHALGTFTVPDGACGEAGFLEKYIEGTHSEGKAELPEVLRTPGSKRARRLDPASPRQAVEEAELCPESVSTATWLAAQR